MMAFGIVGRIGSGFIADRIGGLRTLMLGSALQGVALLLYLSFDGLVSLYVISAVFGLFQGGIVPSYAIIVREYFPPKEAGTRVGIVLMASLFGMALGGWMSGYIFDLTGSYRAAFVNGTRLERGQRRHRAVAVVAPRFASRLCVSRDRLLEQKPDIAGQDALAVGLSPTVLNYNPRGYTWLIGWEARREGFRYKSVCALCSRGTLR